jgi:hypothetical protein
MHEALGSTPTTEKKKILVYNKDCETGKEVEKFVQYQEQNKNTNQELWRTEREV